MARVLSNALNTVNIHDNISNSGIELYYRTPTAKQTAEYTNSLTKRVRNKLVNCTGEVRQKYGADILAGFRKGDFLLPGGKAFPEGKPFSSDQGDPDFDPKWKGHVKKYAPDIIEGLAMHVFEGSTTVDDGITLEDDRDEKREDGEEEQDSLD